MHSHPSAGCLYSIFHLDAWLTISESPRQADIIVCLNSSDARVKKAIELYRLGYADKILVTYPSTQKKGSKGKRIYRKNVALSRIPARPAHRGKLFKQHNAQISLQRITSNS